MSTTTLGDATDKTRIPGELQVEGAVAFGPGAVTGLTRSSLTQQTFQPYTLRPEDWKKNDDLSAPLPATPLTDDLGIVSGAHGTATPTIQTEDLDSAGATSSKMRRTFTLPPEYDPGASVRIRFHAGMLTNPADGTATIDLSVYEADEEAGLGADLYTGAAVSINSTTLADYDFDLTATGLAVGDTLDILVTVAVNDGATGAEVKAIIGAAKMMLDIKG